MAATDTMSDTPPLPPPKDPPALDDETKALIDELMTGPVKGRPLITVVGDDAVSGFNPAPAPVSNA